jgi:excisionase family DNA binding protein
VKPRELHKLQRLITPYNTRKTELVLLISRDLPKTVWISVKSLSFSKDLRKPPWRAGRRKTTTRGVCEGESPAQVVVSCHSNPSLVVFRMPYPKMLLTSRECANRLGVSRRTVQRWLAGGDIPSVVLPQVGARAPRHLIPFPLPLSVTQ